MTLATLAAPARAADNVVQLDVAAGDHDRSRTPVSVEIPESLRAAPRVALFREDTGAEVNLQQLPRDPSRGMFILDEPLPAGASRRYRLQVGSLAQITRPSPVARVHADRVLTVAVNGKHVLQYNLTTVDPPAGMDPVYRRSGHIHPIWTPAGKIVTDEFPVDHPHQHGLFAAWVATTFEGRHVDFWNQGGKTGTVEHASLDAATSGDVFAEFTATLRHVDLSAPDGPKAALNETWTVRVYANAPNASDPDASSVRVAAARIFLFDIESRQTCAGDSPLTLNEYHYGGMAFRGAADWFKQPEHDFLTSEGKTRVDGNHTRPNWVCEHGLVGGSPCCVVVMSHPSNVRSPQPVRLHPDKPYFVFTPPVLGEFQIRPGEEYVARYRYVVHDGPVDTELYERLWRDYAEPPTVEVK
jgi:hypothetical protein